MKYVIGTRGSKLALAQTEDVKRILEEAYPEESFEIKIIKTTGDINQTQALDAIGAKGIFTDEIEAELLSGEIHLAVHSMKDMPDKAAEGLCFAKAWKRQDPRDVLILKKSKSLDELPSGAVIATGSKRRAYQLRQLRSDLRTVDIRGNVDTRIRKLFDDSLGIDGIVLAAAGLKRLGREDEITQYLSVSDMIPAPAQGSLAIEVRQDNAELLDKIDRLSLADEEAARSIERGFLSAIGGDCHLPVGAYYDPSGVFYALFGSEDGSRLATAQIAGDAASAEQRNQIIEQAVLQIQQKLKG